MARDIQLYGNNLWFKNRLIAMRAPINSQLGELAPRVPSSTLLEITKIKASYNSVHKLTGHANIVQKMLNFLIKR